MWRKKALGVRKMPCGSHWRLCPGLHACAIPEHTLGSIILCPAHLPLLLHGCGSLGPGEDSLPAFAMCPPPHPKGLCRPQGCTQAAPALAVTAPDFQLTSLICFPLPLRAGSWPLSCELNKSKNATSCD